MSASPMPFTYADVAPLQADSLENATLVRVVPKKNKGTGEIVPLIKKKVGLDGLLVRHSQ
jgi:hypothetical protein